jgi:hypothetical protein
MDPAAHKRFLDYRERHVYFGAKKKRVDAAEFEKLDAEQRTLEELGDRRTDEEEARFVELCEILFRD